MSSLKIISFLTLFHLLITIGSPVSIAKESECFTMGYSSLGPTFDARAQKLKDTFAMEGICLSMEGFPSKRGTVMFKNEVLDGYYGRIPSWGEKFDLPGFAVPEPIDILRGYLFLTDPDTDPKYALQNLSVATIRGSAWSEHLVAKNKNALYFTSVQQILKMLHIGRIRGGLISEEAATANAAGLKPFTRHLVREVKFHIWLHNRHAGQKDKFNQVIKKIWAEGNWP